MEQMAEYEEDGAGRQLPPALTNLDQRSQHSQGSQQLAMRQSSNRSIPIPTNQSQSNGQRTPGSRVPVDFKNMNTVMQTQPSQHSAASQGGGVSNRSMGIKN